MKAQRKEKKGERERKKSRRTVVKRANRNITVKNKSNSRI